MKRLIVALLSLALLLACVPTPEEDFVAQKDMTQMIEQAKQTPTADTAGQSASEPVTAEDRFTLTFTGSSTEDFRVEVDAVVTRPDVPMPILRVSPGDYDNETANRFYQVLTEGYDLYTEDQLNTAPVLDQKIQEAMDEIANGNDEQPMKDYLNELMEKRKTAPDEVGEPVKQIDLNEYARYLSINDRQLFYVEPNRTYYDGRAGKCAYLFFCNRERFDPSSWETLFWVKNLVCCKGMETVPTGVSLNTTPVEAEAKIQALLDRLDRTDLSVCELAIVENEAGACAYVARCNRISDGIEVAHPCETSGGYEGSTYPEWGYEQAIVYWTDDGLAYFSYRSPLVIEDTVVAESALLPFDDIMDRFQSMMCATYEVRVLDPGYSASALTYHITEITLTLQRVNEENSVDSGLLVPVWNFWGYQSYVSVYDGQTYEDVHFDGWKSDLGPILSINAVTGAVIDPVKGY